MLRDDLPVRRIALAMDAYDHVPWNTYVTGVNEFTTSDPVVDKALIKSRYSGGGAQGIHAEYL